MERKAKFMLLATLSILAIYSLWNTTSQIGFTPNYARLSSSSWDETQLERKQLVQTVCRKYNLSKPLVEIVENHKNTVFFSVDDVHQVVFFRTPKVGSTTWSSIISRASGAYKDQYAMTRTQSKTFILNSFTKKERLFRLQNYRKIFFVRHPYERLVSAFFNKFYSDIKSLIHIYRQELGRHIVGLYRDNATTAQPGGYNITFEELVRYLTDGNRIDEHFEPMYQIAHACSVHYDFVGHYETFMEDSLAILDRVRINATNIPWKNRSNKDPAKVRHLYGTLDADLQRKLYNLFKVDFEMFGYTNYLDDSNSV